MTAGFPEKMKGFEQLSQPRIILSVFEAIMPSSHAFDFSWRRLSGSSVPGEELDSSYIDTLEAPLFTHIEVFVQHQTQTDILYILAFKF